MRHKQHRDQVQIPFHRAFEAEFRTAVLAGAMVDDLLADAAEPGLLGQERNEAVHLAVDLDGLHHLAAVGFQPAVEIVEPDARRGPGRPIEEFAGPAFADRVVAFLFPPRDQIVALFEDHAAQFGDFVGRILQVGVHRNDDLAFRSRESAVEGRGLAVVARETDAPDGRILRLEPFDLLPRAVRRTVVDQNKLVRKPVFAHHAVDPCRQFGQGLRLVVERHDDRYIQFIHPYWLVPSEKTSGSRLVKAAINRPKKPPLIAEASIPLKSCTSGERISFIIISIWSPV